VHLSDAPGGRGSRRSSRSTRRDLASRAGVDAPPGPLSRSRLYVPLMRREALHRGAPHPALAWRREDDRREPGPGLLVPPSTGPRVRLADGPLPGGRRGMVPTERDPHASRATLADARRGVAIERHPDACRSTQPDTRCGL